MKNNKFLVIWARFSIPGIWRASIGVKFWVESVFEVETREQPNPSPRGHKVKKHVFLWCFSEALTTFLGGFRNMFLGGAWPGYWEAFWRLQGLLRDFSDCFQDCSWRWENIRKTTKQHVQKPVYFLSFCVFSYHFLTNRFNALYTGATYRYPWSLYSCI